MQMSEPIISITLPSLLAKTSNGMSGSADIRFLSLKIFTDLTIQYLHDDSVYDPAKDCNGSEEDPVGVQTRMLSEIIQVKLFPRVLSLL